jgi:hypothetical protein
MNIKSVVPGSTELRKYLSDILSEHFGFSEPIHEFVLQHYFPETDSVKKINISVLSDEDVLKILETFDQVPDALYYITDKDGNILSDSNSLTHLREVQCTDKSGGLAVFAAFGLQIYYLFNEKGEYILGPCHDLSLGLNFTLESRDSGDWALWQYFCYKNNKLEYLDSGGFSMLDFFPYSYEGENTQILKEASAFEKDNEEFVSNIILQEPISILYASERLKHDKVFLKKILSTSEFEYNSIFPYLSIGLREDPEIFSIVGITEKSYHKTFINIDECSKMKNDHLLLEILENNPFLYPHFPAKFRYDKEIVFRAVKRNGNLLEYVSEQLRSDMELVLTAVQNDGSALQYADETLRSDKEIVKAAILKNPANIKFASDIVKNDKDFINEIFRLHPESFSYLASELNKINNWDDIDENLPF